MQQWLLPFRAPTIQILSAKIVTNILTQMSFRTVGVPNYNNETTDTLKNAPTRTSLEADQTQVTWNANDVIAIGYKGSTAGAVQPFTTPTQPAM